MSLEKHTFETEKHDYEEEEEAIAVEANPVQANPVAAETVRVTAPATLVEGATFEATVDGIPFMAVVPKPGVMEGDTFEVPYPSRSSTSTLHRSPLQKPAWRSDLFSCCGGGACMCVAAFFCPLILHTQVMERLNLTLGGCRPRLGTGQRPKSGLGKFATFAIAMVVLYTLLIMTASQELYPVFAVVYFCMYAVMVFIFVALVCTRKSFRQTYNLPVTCCSTGGDDCLDDCCVTYFCSPCSAIQMATHSHDPQVHSYLCFSKTGLRKHSQQAMSRNTDTEIV